MLLLQMVSFIQMMKVEIDENWWKVSLKNGRRYFRAITVNWLKFMAEINKLETTEIEELSSMITMRNTDLCLACRFLLLAEMV
jgi:hypothetical protein